MTFISRKPDSILSLILSRTKENESEYVSCKPREDILGCLSLIALGPGNSESDTVWNHTWNELCSATTKSVLRQL